MSMEKEFEGKTLDEAIEAARAFFGVEREKLEIEIVNDAQGGIFGLMGAKKAKIRAAKVRIPSLDLLDTPDDSAGEHTPAEKKPAPRKPRQEQRPKAAAPERDKSAQERERNTPERERAESAPRGESSPRERRPDRTDEGRPDNGGRGRRPSPRPDEADRLGEARDDLPDLDLDALDPAVVAETVAEVVGRLVRPIVGDVPATVTTRDGRVHVALDCGDSSGLLVGRDGQTLAAVQYLASRIGAKALGGNFRLFIDAGNYRERQEDKLRELALELADKACKTGRSQSTRPLSAYQRRIIHLALENHQTVLTCSKGDGLQRRVVVQPKRSRQENPTGPEARDAAALAENGPDEAES